MKIDAAWDWDVEGDDFGGLIVRHRHWDEMTPAYVHGGADEVWAECAMCGASVELGDPSRLGLDAVIS